MVCTPFLLVVSGVGLFQSNALQYGIDQLDFPVWKFLLALYTEITEQAMPFRVYPQCCSHYLTLTFLPLPLCVGEDSY